ncbi:heme exporter protein CcmB, partial [Vibrio diabolicus]|nr:heme exporter protein CcmB [Vibrio diabolicus]
MIPSMTTIILRELLIAFRRQADILNPLWFFII